MQAVRHLLAQRHLAVLICASALLLKLLLPTGYMVANDRGVVTVTICSGTASQMMTMPVMDGAIDGTMPGGGPAKDHGKVEMPCAYAGLSAQVIGAVDAVFLLAALAIVAALALLAVPRPALRSAPYLRPPLRGPPITLT